MQIIVSPGEDSLGVASKAELLRLMLDILFIFLVILVSEIPIRPQKVDCLFCVSIHILKILMHLADLSIF